MSQTVGTCWCLRRVGACDHSEMAIEEHLVRSNILELLAKRGEGRSICPSDAARALDADDFRALMPSVRAAAQTLVEAGRIEVTQRGDPVDIRNVKGPVRLRLRP